MFFHFPTCSLPCPLGREMNIDRIAHTLLLTLPAHLCLKMFQCVAFVPFVAAHSAPPTHRVRRAAPPLNHAMILNTSQRACRFCPGVIYLYNLNILQALPKCLLWSLSHSLNSLDAVVKKKGLVKPNEKHAMFYALCANGAENIKQLFCRFFPPSIFQRCCWEKKSF